MQSPPPNPNDFPSLEAYEAAVHMYEEFFKMVHRITEVENTSETEEEYNKKMEELGFMTHEDEYCEGDWCQKNEQCLAMILECSQESWNEHFFWNMMPEKEKIINWKLGIDNCATMSPSWKKSTTKEGKMVELFFEIEEALIFRNVPRISFVKLVKQEVVQNFGRSFYLSFKKVLFDEPLIEKEVQGVTQFLKANDVLEKKCSNAFLRKFEEILRERKK